MPELPEVETVCRGLEPVLNGQTILSVDLHREGLRNPFPKNMKKRLAGTKILRVGRRAKYILVHLGSGDVLILHLGMSGRILVEPDAYAPKKHDHMVLNVTPGRKIVFNDPRRFGIADIIAASEIDTYPAFRATGPEPLSNHFSGPALEEALSGRKTPIKVALLDQRIVAGIGNIYACEALFHAGVSPTLEAGKVKGRKAAVLVKAIRAVLQKAIDSGGSSLRDYRKATGELGGFQHHFAVYDREGMACPGCHCDVSRTKGISRITQGGRSTFYCPRKQK